MESLNNIEIKENFDSVIHNQYYENKTSVINKLIKINGGEIYISLLIINKSFDRFKRKLPPTRITNFNDNNFISEKKKLIKDSYSFIISSSYEKCVFEYNKQVDDVRIIYEDKIETMKEKYEYILKTKINIRKKKFNNILK
jgi:hypothetical protein